MWPGSGYEESMELGCGVWDKIIRQMCQTKIWLQGGGGLDRAKVEQGCVLMI